MGWLPTLRLFGACIAERDWEAEGTCLQLVVGPFVWELTFARKDRVFPEDTDAR